MIRTSLLPLTSLCGRRKAQRRRQRSANVFRRAWRLGAEQLEERRLMASDFDSIIEWNSVLLGKHNSIDAEDVNDDGQCTAIDALLVINELNRTASGSSQFFSDVNNDGAPSPLDALLVINRLNHPAENAATSMARRRPPASPPTTPAPSTGDVRSFDGTGNNLAHPQWGSTDEQLLRKAASDYGDGISTPAGDDRPSAREISNALAAHADDSTSSDRDLTAFIYVWGQFLDHDMDLTKSASPSERLDISVPVGDAQFDPTASGNQIIPMTRSAFDTSTGTSFTNPRQQLNQITAWIDGSMIYGSDSMRAQALRSFSGGRLRVSSTSVGDLPPLNSDGLPIANDAHRIDNTKLFLAGDIRSNENIELTSLHTLFIREHNRLAAQIAAENPSLNDEAIYQRARALIIGEIQAITYKEWLPALLGASAIKSYQGYDPNVNPGIANEFSTAAFRLHTTINDDVEFFDNSGRGITFDYEDDHGNTVTVNGEVALFDAFFNPTMFAQTGVNGILKYAASTHAEEVDNQLVDSLRNFLFGQPGQGGLDLASLNIQRGRDHGLADYNAARVAYGLPAVTSFAQITSDREVQAALEQLYGSVDNIDLWVGGLAEDHLRDSSMGPLFQRILAEQFTRLRDGDRFWYQRQFSGPQLATLENTTLASVIERNTDITGLQSNVFIFRAEVNGQVFNDANGNGRQDRNELPLPKVSVELVNDEGDVIATTLTGRDGSYQFTQFPETGDYRVQLVAPAGLVSTTISTFDFLVRAGDAHVKSGAFGLKKLLAAVGEELPLSSTMANTAADDLAEENDTYGTAKSLGTLTSSTTISNLVMADAHDWFRFNLSTAGSAGGRVAINFSNAQGNLDLRLYNALGQVVRTSAGTSDEEQVSLSELPSGSYWLDVYGFAGALNPAYSLSIIPTAEIADDSYEENDTFAAAKALGTPTVPQNVPGLVMADSQDWYRFTTTATGTSGDFVSIAFQHAQGNLALELYNAAGTLLGASNGATNSELISLVGRVAGTYFVRVYGAAGAHNPNYSLSIHPPASIVTPAPTSNGGFHIDIVTTGLTASQQTIFQQAAARWESIIVGDLPSVTFNGQVIDDLLINASATAIDGVGNVLGQAGPDRFRNGSLLPYHGTMQFDSSDLAAMQANGTLLSVVMHEMGHVLGIGTLWANKGLLSGAGTTNPRYTGQHGLAAYNALAGVAVTGIPVENAGGSGTRDAHWRETIFGSELMTGFVGPGTRLPLSRITVSALADLGYSVNYAAADAYTLPGSSASLIAAAFTSSPAADQTASLQSATYTYQHSSEPQTALFQTSPPLSIQHETGASLAVAASGVIEQPADRTFELLTSDEQLTSAMITNRIVDWATAIDSVFDEPLLSGADSFFDVGARMSLGWRRSIASGRNS